MKKLIREALPEVRDESGMLVAEAVEAVYEEVEDE